jgi:hypothetical protein
MATLQELFDMRNDSELRNRVAAAGWNAAKDIFVEDAATPNHSERLVWAVKALGDDGDGGTVGDIFKAAIVLLQDNTAPTDAQVQTSVEQVIDKFATIITQPITP